MECWSRTTTDDRGRLNGSGVHVDLGLSTATDPLDIRPRTIAIAIAITNHHQQRQQRHQHRPPFVLPLLIILAVLAPPWVLWYARRWSTGIQTPTQTDGARAQGAVERGVWAAMGTAASGAGSIWLCGLLRRQARAWGGGLVRGRRRRRRGRRRGRGGEGRGATSP
jgi:hypothetical protein